MHQQQRLIAQNPAPTPPVSSPPPVLEWGALLSLCAAAIAWLGRNLWSYFSSKEAGESALLQTLVTDLRESQTRMLADSREASLKLVEQIAFKETLNTSQREVQRALTTQTALYTEAIERLSRMEQKLDALHRRLDGGNSSS